MSSLGIDTSRLTLSGASLTGVSGISGISNPPQGAPPAPPTRAVGDTDGDAAAASVSKQALFLSKLKQLQQTDPAKYKQVLTDVATAFQDAAKTATGAEQQHLNALASKFTQAASGDLSALQPPQPPASPAAAAYTQNAPDAGASLASAGAKKGGHHGRHHHGGSQSPEVAAAFQELSAALDNPASTTSATNAAASDATGKTASTQS